MQFVSINEQNVIEGVFDREIVGCLGKRVVPIDSSLEAKSLIGRKVGVMEPSEMKVAIICNWRTPCGISTYSEYLVNALRPKVGELRIFSEIEAKADTSHDEEENVARCWKRGESMSGTIEAIKAWGANFVIVQHEFGIFPKATHFLKMLQGLEHIPHTVVMHSVYGNHLDKTICSSAIKNLIVHSEAGKAALESLGHTTNFIQVIPHGCYVFDDVKELWNIFQTPYAIVQFGFGFFYKGVDRAIQAIGHLKNANPEKYKDIFYCYLCSESANCIGTHAQYYNHLEKLINDLGLHDNVAIIRKFHSEEIINTYLRTSKLALFPYVTDPNNIVFGASGAIRMGMSNNIPVIASESHMFDDLEGVVPRPGNAVELAREIDKIFSDEKYRQNLIRKNQTHVQENTWEITADRYLAAMKNILEKERFIQLKN
jgi:glycosyltransferase involved in cell wall biosynthesis